MLHLWEMEGVGQFEGEEEPLGQSGWIREGLHIRGEGQGHTGEEVEIVEKLRFEYCCKHISESIIEVIIEVIFAIKKGGE